jgi:hypothetical protein
MTLNQKSHFLSSLEEDKASKKVVAGWGLKQEKEKRIGTDKD